MKRFLCALLSICFVLSLFAGCKKPADSKTEQPSACHPVSDGAPAPIPLLENDTESVSSLGLYDGSAFGIVEKTCEHGITLTIQKQSFFFQWTDLAKKAYDHFKLQPGSEVAIPFVLEGNTYIANNVEKVM